MVLNWIVYSTAPGVIGVLAGDDHERDVLGDGRLADVRLDQQRVVADERCFSDGR